MSEWWTYSLSDFLLFSPRTYYRLFELYNAEVYPAQLVAVALGIAVLVALVRDGASNRLAAAVLGAAWIFVAWAFHWQRYSTINWAATYFAAAFALEALLLVGLGTIGGRLRFRLQPTVASRIGWALYAFALVLQPLIGPLAGRAWTGVEIFGIAPDPTVVATLGLALLLDRYAWALLPIPLAWCVLGGAFEWTMESPDALLLPAAGALTLFVVARRARASDRAPA